MPAPGGGDVTLFRDLAFDVGAGEVVDVTGPSGSGKSSMLTAVARLNPHATAAMALDGVPAKRYDPQRWRAAVAYLPQRPTLTGASVAEAIRLPWTLAVRDGTGDADDGASGRQRRFPRIRTGGDRRARRLLPDERIRATLDALGCSDIELERPPHELSGGQAARVALARTLLTGPRVLLADEVDAGLDDDNAARVAAVMAQAAGRGMAVVRIRHRPPDGLAARVLTLDGGRLTAQAIGTAARTAVPGRAEGPGGAFRPDGATDRGDAGDARRPGGARHDDEEKAVAA